MAVQRWKFVDLSGQMEDYTFRRNPNAMTSPNPSRQFTAEHTSSGLEGRPLVWEGARQLASWSFSGVAWTQEDWQDLEKWVYRSSSRVRVEDHLGRKIVSVFTNVEADLQPGVKSVNGILRPYYGKYTVSALALEVEGF